MKQPNAQKKRMIIGLVFTLWLALMFSPIGNIVAIVTIFSLIIVLYAVGCISSPSPAKKNEHNARKDHHV